MDPNSICPGAVDKRAAELAVTESHAKFYQKETEKDESYRWLADKWATIVEQLKAS
jgi:hypothetical protein